MNEFAIGYAIGYFYGRSYPSHEIADVTMPVEDFAYTQTAAFATGHAAGKRDFEEVDLPLEALSGAVDD